jgi:hypothetical protein
MEDLQKAKKRAGKEENIHAACPLHFFLTVPFHVRSNLIR